MTLPLHDISPETSRLVAASLADPQALTRNAAITWKSGEEWESLARGSIKIVVEEALGDRTAADLSAIGAAAYGVVKDIAVIVEGRGLEPGLSVSGSYNRMQFDDLVAMPPETLEENANHAIIDLNRNTPNLREALDAVAENVVDGPHDRRHVLVGAALMRLYHIAAKVPV